MNKTNQPVKKTKHSRNYYPFNEQSIARVRVAQQVARLAAADAVTMLSPKHTDQCDRQAAYDDAFRSAFHVVYRAISLAFTSATKIVGDRHYSGRSA